MAILIANEVTQSKENYQRKRGALNYDKMINPTNTLSDSKCVHIKQQSFTIDASNTDRAKKKTYTSSQLQMLELVQHFSNSERIQNT